MKAAHPTRILTCCYCGARSLLPVTRAAALVCHGCGAPISRIEGLQPALERMRRRDGEARPAIPHAADHRGGHKPKDRPARRRKGKRRQAGFWHGLRRLADRADDLFDLEDLLDFD